MAEVLSFNDNNQQWTVSQAAGTDLHYFTNPRSVSRNCMDIQTAHSAYRNEENYFAPEYDGENNALNKFYSLHSTLTTESINYLRDILQSADNWLDKYFVADLMYLYDPIPEQLLGSMIECAIQNEAPSFNRIFLKPCLKSYGLERIKHLFNERERNGNTLEKKGIERLRYWLRPVEFEKTNE